MMGASYLAALPSCCSFMEHVSPGGLVLDEAIEAAKTVLNGNTAAVMLVLLPHQHGNVPAHVLKSRRLLEDKLLPLLGFISCTKFLSASGLMVSGDCTN